MIDSSAAARQTPASATAAPGAAPKASLSGDMTTFLRMLTAQIRNQDPLKPIESSDFAVQLATFSGVEQQVRTNQLLTSLRGQISLSGMAQMAGWVGMEARVSSPVAFQGRPVTLMPEPAQDADKAVIVVLDAAHREVLRQTVPPSAEPVLWPGTDASGAAVPAGQYSFRLDSYRAGQLLSAAPLDAYGTVTEIRNGASGPVVVLAGGAQVAARDVKALRGPAP